MKPEHVLLTGDQAEAAKWVGFARSKLVALRGQTFGTRRFHPAPGVEVMLKVYGGQEYLHIKAGGVWDDLFVATTAAHATSDLGDLHVVRFEDKNGAYKKEYPASAFGETLNMAVWGSRAYHAVHYDDGSQLGYLNLGTGVLTAITGVISGKRLGNVSATPEGLWMFDLDGEWPEARYVAYHYGFDGTLKDTFDLPFGGPGSVSYAGFATNGVKHLVTWRGVAVDVDMRVEVWDRATGTRDFILYQGESDMLHGYGGAITRNRAYQALYSAGPKFSGIGCWDPTTGASKGEIIPSDVAEIWRVFSIAASDTRVAILTYRSETGFNTASPWCTLHLYSRATDPDGGADLFTEIASVDMTTALETALGHGGFMEGNRLSFNYQAMFKK